MLLDFSASLHSARNDGVLFTSVRHLDRSGEIFKPACQPNQTIIDTFALIRYRFVVPPRNDEMAKSDASLFVAMGLKRKDPETFGAFLDL
jgi:hypothetical protein